MPPGEGYRLTYLNGRWAGETQLVQEDDPSRREGAGEPARHHQPSDQSVVCHRCRRRQTAPTPTRSTAECGLARWAGAATGRFSVEQTPHQQVRVTGGYNTFDFAYPCSPASSSKRRHSTADSRDRGFGEASRLLHRFHARIHPSRRPLRQAPARALQLLGSHRVQRRRTRASTPGREGRQDSALSAL